MTGPVQFMKDEHEKALRAEEARIGQDYAPNLPTIQQRLRELGLKRMAKQHEYGDNYKTGGKLLMGLFPRGFVIQTEEEANRLTLIVFMATKLSRYCENLKAGGHADSLDDLALYAMLARDCDGQA